MKNLKSLVVSGIIGAGSLIGFNGYGQEQEDSIIFIDLPLINYQKIGLSIGEGGKFFYDSKGRLEFNRMLFNEINNNGIFEKVVDIYFKYADSGKRIIEKIEYYKDVDPLETCMRNIKKNPYMIRYSYENMKKYFDERDIKNYISKEGTLIKYDLKKEEIKTSEERFDEFKKFLKDVEEIKRISTSNLEI